MNIARQSQDIKGAKEATHEQFARGYELTSLVKPLKRLKPYPENPIPLN